MERLFSSIDHFERDMGLVAICLMALGWPLTGLAIGNKLNGISAILGTQTPAGTYGPWIILCVGGFIATLGLIYLLAQPKNRYILPLTYPTGVLSAGFGIGFGIIANTNAVEWFSAIFGACGFMITLTSVLLHKRVSRLPWPLE